jgi:predicted O-methyltransferase YrrM
VRLPWRDLAPGPGPVISTSLTERETDELRRLAADADVLEIGSAFGYSAVAMALAGGRVLAVDPHQQLASYETMLANLGFYNVADRVTIRRGDSRAVFPELVGAGLTFDLVWIDGDHAAEMVTHDVGWAVKLLRPGGTLACHDHGEATCPGVAQALDAWRPYDYKVDTLAVYLNAANT